MPYILQFTDKAKEHVLKLKESEVQAYQKLKRLLFELEHHPRAGTGKPKRLSGNLAGYWSRRITDKHRLVYSIDDEVITVDIVSVWGHYDDK